MENLYTKDCIRTFTGKYIDPLDIDTNLICIEDIAHSLAFQCRFGGHLPKFYTVAQHCVRCSTEFESSIEAFEALMHDASEAYLLDLPSPVKRRIPQYKMIEERIMTIIAHKFGFKYPMSEQVHRADVINLEYEWDNVFINDGGIEVWSIERSEAEFLKRFNELIKLQ